MTDFVFLRRLERAPELDTKIYRLKGPGVNDSLATKTARRLRLDGSLRIGELTKDAEEVTYSEGPFVVTLFRPSRALRYYDRMRWQVDDGVSHVEFSDDKAIELAQEYLETLDLMPLAESQVLKVSHLRVAAMERETGAHEERVVDVGVDFQRMIDGIPVEGAGGKVTVYIDHHGSVTGLERVWRDIAKVYREVPSDQLRSPQYAEKDLVRHWSKVGASRIEVTETRFGYYELGAESRQRYLQPAYVMPLVIVGPDERFVVESVHVVAAASKPVGRLMPRHKPAEEQPPRTVLQ